MLSFWESKWKLLNPAQPKVIELLKVCTSDLLKALQQNSYSEHGNNEQIKINEILVIAIKKAHVFEHKNER